MAAPTPAPAPAPAPALRINSSEAAVVSSITNTAAVNTTAASVPPTSASVSTANRTDTPPKTLRGLNKPKCKQCGNVARSRCPFESCKSCCAKAQNPCHIHVLKANATFSDKALASSSPIFDQQSTEASTSGNSLRASSLRQLSNTFSQFNNVQISLRSRKPLTRKDASAINEWRFSKLKEYKDRNVEVENEAFDRYMQNVNLLEELLSVKFIPGGSTEDTSSILHHNPTTMEGSVEAAVSGVKWRLRSNSMRQNYFRRRMQQIVEDGLEKLQSCELDDGNEAIEQSEIDISPKRAKHSWAERVSTLSDLIEKLNKARNEEDLISCLEVKTQLFNHHMQSSQSKSEGANHSMKKNLEAKKELNYSLPIMVTTTEIDEETLANVNAHFSSLDQIGAL